MMLYTDIPEVTDSLENQSLTVTVIYIQDTYMLQKPFSHTPQLNACRARIWENHVVMLFFLSLLSDKRRRDNSVEFIGY